MGCWCFEQLSSLQRLPDAIYTEEKANARICSSEIDIVVKVKQDKMAIHIYPTYHVEFTWMINYVYNYYVVGHGFRWSVENSRTSALDLLTNLIFLRYQSLLFPSRRRFVSQGRRTLWLLLKLKSQHAKSFCFSMSPIWFSILNSPFWCDFGSTAF